MSYFEMIILYFIKVLDGERSIYAIYHMLKGKKSSQTIHDSHLFGLGIFFGTHPGLERPELEEAVRNLKISGLVSEEGTATRITERGLLLLSEEMEAAPLPDGLNGMYYSDGAVPFWERLSLLIQTLSHIISGQPRFYPIQRSPEAQNWVRQYLASAEIPREQLALGLLKELEGMLAFRPLHEREFFVRRLTGPQRIGSTFEQLAAESGTDEWFVRYSFLAVLHYLLAVPDRQKQPILAAAGYGLDGKKRGRLTNSTKRTREFLLEGRDVAEIAEIRNLKKSTVEDHVVEIVHIDKDFPISRYVPKEMEGKIAAAAKSANTRKLKAIKLAVGEASYFQIRLVLAKEGSGW